MADEAVLDVGAELESEGAEEVEQGAEAEVEGTGAACFMRSWRIASRRASFSSL